MLISCALEMGPVITFAAIDDEDCIRRFPWVEWLVPISINRYASTLLNPDYAIGEPILIGTL